MIDMENILGFDFVVNDEYIKTEIVDTRWLDSDDFEKLKKLVEKRRLKKIDVVEERIDDPIVKINEDSIFVHRNYLLEFVRFYDYDKYIFMIENAADNFFDSGKIIPSKIKKETVFDTLRSFIL